MNDNDRRLATEQHNPAPARGDDAAGCDGATGSLEILPDDPVKRDELIIHIRKSSITLTNWIAFGAFAQHFYCVALQIKDDQLAWVQPLILATYGGNVLASLIPSGAIKDAIDKLRKKH